VVFLNGYQQNCQGSDFRGTFASADQVLQADGRVSLFFDNCAFPGSPRLEELGNKLGEFLRGLRYQNGEPVGDVDLVAHSMGGLIVRSYLAGKQPQEGVFLPPAETKVRKVVFLGTPQFGTPASNLFGGGNVQVAQLAKGSQFIFDLATWNQGMDDLRGVDAIAVLGNSANGLFTMRSRFGDGVTTLTSGSLGFFGPERTRIVPYCHTGGFAAALCSGARGNLAQLNSADHDAARILLSFLNNTDQWRQIGESVEQNALASKGGGLYFRLHDANDRPLAFTKAAATGIGELELETPGLLVNDYFETTSPLALTLTLPSATAAANVSLITGSTRAAIAKPGPYIHAIFPSAAALFPRTVAPGSLVSLYGNQLATTSGETQVSIAGRVVPISFANEQQINALLPDDASGLVRATVKNAAGEHSVNLLVEPVAPAVFSAALNAVTGVRVGPQAPLRAGDYVALFATGLGATRADGGLNWAVMMPEVSIGGQPCTVTYAGRAPGFPGLDQINCQLSANVAAGDAVPVLVRSGKRVSNVTTLPVR
jgi:uncharacterized protein (TIGR03437 family)